VPPLAAGGSAWQVVVHVAPPDTVPSGPRMGMPGETQCWISNMSSAHVTETGTVVGSGGGASCVGGGGGGGSCRVAPPHATASKTHEKKGMKRARIQLTIIRTKRQSKAYAGCL
jgi:hypothetical protein